jgi:hypothetical protein
MKFVCIRDQWRSYIALHDKCLCEGEILLCGELGLVRIGSVSRLRRDHDNDNDNDNARSPLINFAVTSKRISLQLKKATYKVSQHLMVLWWRCQGSKNDFLLYNLGGWSRWPRYKNSPRAHPAPVLSPYRPHLGPLTALLPSTFSHVKQVQGNRTFSIVHSGNSLAFHSLHHCSDIYCAG